MGTQLLGTVHINREKHAVDRGEALRYMGMSDGGESQEVDDALRQRIEDSFTHCEECSTPAWTYRVFPLQETDEGLALVGTVLVLTGDDIRTHLHGAKYCAVMAATCGLANERELQIQSAKGTVEALAFDAAMPLSLKMRTSRGCSATGATAQAMATFRSVFSLRFSAFWKLKNYSVLPRRPRTLWCPPKASRHL